MADPHLETLADRSRKESERVEQLFASNSPAQLAWKPDPGTWNVIECIEHLVTTDRLYLPAIRKRLEQNRAAGASGAPFEFTWFGRMFVNAAGPVVRRRLPAPKPFRPPPASTDLTVLDRFREVQLELQALLAEADGVELNGRKFASPITRLVRLTLGEGLTLLVGHTQRHVNQAETLTRGADFPSA